MSVDDGHRCELLEQTTYCSQPEMFSSELLCQGMGFKYRNVTLVVIVFGLNWAMIQYPPCFLGTIFFFAMGGFFVEMQDERPGGVR